MFLLRCRHQSDFELFDTDYQSVSYGDSTVFSLCLEMPNMELYVLYIHVFSGRQAVQFCMLPCFRNV